MSNTEIANKESLLSREQVMKLFGVSSATLWAWEKEGIIKKHKMKRRVYYFESEIMDTLKNR